LNLREVLGRSVRLFRPRNIFYRVNHPADNGASNGKRLHGGLRFASLRLVARGLCAITGQVMNFVLRSRVINKHAREYVVMKRERKLSRFQQSPWRTKRRQVVTIPELADHRREKFGKPREGDARADASSQLFQRLLCSGNCEERPGIHEADRVY